MVISSGYAPSVTWETRRQSQRASKYASASPATPEDIQELDDGHCKWW